MTDQYGERGPWHSGDEKPEIRYWLCCGSKEYPHRNRSCHEAEIGHPERVRFGTAKEHSDWSKTK